VAENEITQLAELAHKNMAISGNSGSNDVEIPQVNDPRVLLSQFQTRDEEEERMWNVVREVIKEDLAALSSEYKNSPKKGLTLRSQRIAKYAKLQKEKYEEWLELSRSIKKYAIYEACWKEELDKFKKIPDVAKIDEQLEGIEKTRNELDAREDELRKKKRKLIS